MSKKNTSLYLWLHALSAEAIQGAASAFLVVSGGNTVGQGAYDLPSVSFRALLLMTVMGGLVGAFSYLKKNPLPPTTEPNEPVAQ